MKRKHLAAATLAGVTLVGGGAGIVSAQTDDTTPTTVVDDDATTDATVEPDPTVADDPTVTDDPTTPEVTPGEGRTRPSGGREGCDDAATGGTPATPESSS